MKATFLLTFIMMFLLTACSSDQDGEQQANAGAGSNPLLNASYGELSQIFVKAEGKSCRTYYLSVQKGQPEDWHKQQCQKIADRLGYKVDHLIDDAVWKRYMDFSEKEFSVG